MKPFERQAIGPWLPLWRYEALKFFYVTDAVGARHVEHDGKIIARSNQNLCFCFATEAAAREFAATDRKRKTVLECTVENPVRERNRWRAHATERNLLAHDGEIRITAARRMEGAQ